MTSWHRERWMSLSGQPPEKAMADPALWHRMRLDDGTAGAAPTTGGQRPG
jgi:hypothetical protein